mmetsp:Transcript_25514/g.73786  ORF Transcript_25514/g.73786 Transcript_25514/m.73786 type:complete len:86 (+) Transcript_25514:521-778(+)
MCGRKKRWGRYTYTVVVCQRTWRKPSRFSLRLQKMALLEQSILESTTNNDEARQRHAAAVAEWEILSLFQDESVSKHLFDRSEET